MYVCGFAMKEVLVVAVLFLNSLLGEVSPACSLTTLVIPSFGPDWILVTLTKLDPTDIYTVTLTQPNGVQIQHDIDYGTTSNIQAFDVVTFQTGAPYTATLVEVGRHRILTTCSLTL